MSFFQEKSFVEKYKHVSGRITDKLRGFVIGYPEEQIFTTSAGFPHGKTTFFGQEANTYQQIKPLKEAVYVFPDLGQLDNIENKVAFERENSRYQNTNFPHDQEAMFRGKLKIFRKNFACGIYSI